MWLALAWEQVLTGLSVQVILCTKEVSVGARKNAFALLVEMGQAFIRFGPSQEGEPWVDALRLGLGGDTSHNNCCIRGGR